jgi:hypothetical protein
MAGHRAFEERPSFDGLCPAMTENAVRESPLRLILTSAPPRPSPREQGGEIRSREKFSASQPLEIAQNRKILAVPSPPRALSVVASVAKQSISPRDGPPTSSQSRSCSKRFQDLARERTRRGANRRAGGSGTVDCFASLAMTGRAYPPNRLNSPPGTSRPLRDRRTRSG